MVTRHFGVPSSNPSTTTAPNTSGDSLKGVYLQMKRKKKPDEEQENELRADAKRSSDIYFHQAKVAKDAMKARLAKRNVRPFPGKLMKMGPNVDERQNTGPKTSPIKLGPPVSERPTGPKPSGNTGQSYRTMPEAGGRNPRNLTPRQLAMLKRLRKRRGQ